MTVYGIALAASHGLRMSASPDARVVPLAPLLVYQQQDGRDARDGRESDLDGRARRAKPLAVLGTHSNSAVAYLAKRQPIFWTRFRRSG